MVLRTKIDGIEKKDRKIDIKMAKQIDRQKDRKKIQRCRGKDRQIGSWMDIQTDKSYIMESQILDRTTNRKIARQIDRQIDKQIDRQIDRQIDIQIDRQMNRFINIKKKQIDRWKNRQIDG